MSTIRELIDWGKDRLRKAGSESPRLDAELLCCHTVGVDRLFLYKEPDHRPDINDRMRYESLIERREKGEPVAYLMGEKEFFGHQIEVNANVLIPRPDTEKLVETAIAHLPKGEESLVIDVCTGSGCVAIAIALARPKARVVASDISDAALEVAMRNVNRHQVANRIELRQGDLLEPCRDLSKVDLIVANPPYVKRSAIPTLSRDVYDFEPHLALFGGGEQGLSHHVNILTLAQELLVPGGIIILEIGYDQKPDIDALRFDRLSFPQFIEDDAGNIRLVKYHQLR